MRLFLAAVPPEGFRREVEERLASARRALELPPARWVRPELWHVTLAFLGDRSETDARRLAEGLPATLASVPAFETRAAGVGAFPPRGRVRTVWLGFEPVHPWLELERASRELVVGTLGADALEARTFRPHLTLARCRRPWSRRSLTGLAEVFGDAGATWTVDEAEWVESRLGAGGPTYRTVGRAALGPA